MDDNAHDGIVTARLARRRFLQAIPAAVAGSLAVPALAQQQTPAAPRIDAATLDCAEKVFGIDFSEAEEEQMARGVSRNLDTFEQLRQMDIPLDTEPAITFRPYLPGKKPKPGATPGAKIKMTAAAPPAARRASLDDLAFLPITALAPMIQRREVSATDLTKMYLARLKKYGPKLNCVVTLTEDLALAQAAAADSEIRAGRYKGPLHGIPWGAKDLFATKGIPTTWGAGPYQNQVFDHDATIVERLRDAGAVLMAKLSMGALAQGDNWFRGQTKNPWNPDDPSPQRSGSSGSSAGPGSATAAGLVVFGIGTETRGSIISPSSANGVTGLRPTYGRVSRYGAMALSWTMDKVGPMCRSVEDCALVFNAIYGPDGRDDTVVDAPFTWSPDVPLSKLRIGYIKSEFEPQPAGSGRGAGGGRGRGGLTPEQQQRQREERLKIYTDALDVYRKAGATLEPIESAVRHHERLEHDRLRPQRRGRGRLRRPDAQRGHRRQVARKLAEHVPDPPLRAGGGIHPRPARAHAAHARDGHADVAVRRVRLDDEQLDAGCDEPDGAPGRRAEGGIPEPRAGRADGHRPALRRSHDPARRPRLRARDRLAQHEPGDDVGLRAQGMQGRSAAPGSVFASDCLPLRL